MARKKGNEIYGLFSGLIAYSCDAAEYLCSILKNFESTDLDAAMEKMHELEHGADNQKHELMRKLAREFIPPIDREDVASLAQELDEVTDAIEDVLQRIYMYNIRSIRSDALEMADVLLVGCETLKKIMDEFSNFKRSESLHGLIVEVNRLEEVGDRLYVSSMRRLFSERGDAIDALAWSETFKCIEDCFDSMEHAANTVENIVMKNT